MGVDIFLLKMNFTRAVGVVGATVKSNSLQTCQSQTTDCRWVSVIKLHKMDWFLPLSAGSNWHAASLWLHRQFRVLSFKQLTVAVMAGRLMVTNVSLLFKQLILDFEKCFSRNIQLAYDAMRHDRCESSCEIGFCRTSNDFPERLANFPVCAINGTIKANLEMRTKKNTWMKIMECSKWTKW